MLSGKYMLQSQCYWWQSAPSLHGRTTTLQAVRKLEVSGRCRLADTRRVKREKETCNDEM